MAQIAIFNLRYFFTSANITYFYSWDIKLDPPFKIRVHVGYMHAGYMNG